jgi:NAD(P)-dependent dehydrogenase (short-subunit alcohol dehydrogenase family)
VALSEGLRAELLGKGVQVTTIVPGLMRTGGHINARFKGRVEEEYTWFSLGASLPFTSIDAESAARQIVRDARRGTAEHILSLPANLLGAFHGLFPGLTADLMALVNQLALPSAEGAAAQPERGRELQERVGSRALNALTAMGREAARRHQSTQTGNGRFAESSA